LEVNYVTRPQAVCLLWDSGAVLLRQLVLGGGPLSDRESVAFLHDVGRIDRPKEGVDILLDLLWNLEALHLLLAAHG
jgi:hypothetical protein